MRLATLASRPVCPVLAEFFGTHMAIAHSSTPVQMHMVLDEQQLWKHLDGDRNLLRELTALFVHNYPLYLRAIRHAIRQRDSAALVEGALAVKGMVGNFGATEALQAATRLETLGQQGKLQQAAETYLVLDRTLGRLAAALLGLSRTACYRVEE